MTDDLVKRPLRCLVTNNPVGTDTEMIGHHCQCQVCQAADRIEQLEAALRNIYDKWENGVGICDVIDAMDAARAALGEKTDGN